jgi:HD superfamily phosphodiesterase
MYTREQKAFLAAVKNKVKIFFDQYPAPGHEFGHALRVAKNAWYIATEERAKNVLLCELSGILHDIGRVPEHFQPNGKTKTHQEWSYELLREWFRDDQVFDFLTTKEKLEVLYAVRNHWNNEANKYDTAWVLRDADKLDAMGAVGINRGRDFNGSDVKRWGVGLRNTMEMTLWFRTTTAKRIMKEKKLVEPIVRYYKRFLREGILPVEL